ncbi:MAG: glycosyltransferase family 39 protein [Bacteroidetes bacterium]|nr:MAG: glycosyltransferase family 39 protein [Bacteroidota bacterium]
MKKVASFLYRNPVALFLLFLFIVYLPVFLPFFHLKNDLITQNLPTRFVISESLYSGYFPWWNPYIHYGIPQYGDMNNGFWNPFLWLIAKTIGYSIYTITLEEMFYLLLGGWGMYKLIKELFSKNTALLTGLAYICCGCAVGRLQHFIMIPGLAFFPFVLLYFIRTHKAPIVKNFIASGFSVFLFMSATHPSQVIGGSYFFLFVILFIYLFRNSATKKFYTGNFWKINFVLLIIAGLCCSVIIVSNLEVLQHISRSSRVPTEYAQFASTTLQSYFSVLFPLAVHKTNFFDTDISMRNVYGGIALIVGLFFYFKNITRKVILFSLLPLLFFVLLASGGWFKTFAWHALPLTGFVRINGEFTYFALLILFLLSSAGLSSLLQKDNYPHLLTAPFKWLLMLFLTTSLISLILITTTKSSFIFTSSNAAGKYYIKSLFENLSFADLLLIQSLIGIFTVWLIKKYKFSYTASVFIICANLTITTWLSLPFTGLGMKSKKEMQQVINSSPPGIQLQKLTPVSETKLITPENKREFIMLSSFSKKIGNPEMEDYPVQLKSSAAFFSDSALTNFINQQAWLFLSSDTLTTAFTSFDSSAIKVIENGPGKIKCSVSNSGYKFLVLLQNNYPYWRVSMDGKEIKHSTAFKTFISVPVTDGDHIIEFNFNPKPIRTVLQINITILILLLLFLCIKKTRNKSLFK